MRGSLTDFYTDAPRQRAPLMSWPADFDPIYIEVFADKPLAPEIRECERCSERADCRPGKYAKPECEESEGNPSANTFRNSAEIQRLIIQALQAEPLTLYQIEARLGLTYTQAKFALANLRKAGVVANEAPNGTFRANVWRLVGVVVEPVCHVSKTKQILILLRHRPRSIRELAEQVDTSESSVRRLVTDLIQAGHVVSEPIKGQARTGSRRMYRAVEQH